MKDTTILNQDISDLEITDLVTTDLVTKANEVKLLKDLIANDASTGTDDSYTETLLPSDVDSESDKLLNSFTESNAYNPLDPHLIIPIYTIYT